MINLTEEQSLFEAIAELQMDVNKCTEKYNEIQKEIDEQYNQLLTMWDLITSEPDEARWKRHMEGLKHDIKYGYKELFNEEEIKNKLMLRLDDLQIQLDELMIEIAKRKPE